MVHPVGRDDFIQHVETALVPGRLRTASQDRFVEIGVQVLDSLMAVEHTVSLVSLPTERIGRIAFQERAGKVVSRLSAA